MAARAEDSLKEWSKLARFQWSQLSQHLGNAEGALLDLDADPEAVDHITAILANVRSYADSLRYAAEHAGSVLQMEYEKLHEMRERWEDEHHG